MGGTFLRALRMLRHPQLARRLGDILNSEREIESLRKRFPNAFISSDAHIEAWRSGELALGDRARIEYGAILNLGDDLNGYGSLTIGADTWIGPYNNVRLAGGTSITIGAACLVSQFCTIISANHALSRKRRMRDAAPDIGKGDIVIGDDVWLGAGATVLPGVTIGSGAVIGAGAVVTHSIGEYEIWAGNPARRIGERPA